MTHTQRHTERWREEEDRDADRDRESEREGGEDTGSCPQFIICDTPKIQWDLRQEKYVHIHIYLPIAYIYPST